MESNDFDHDFRLHTEKMSSLVKGGFVLVFIAAILKLAALGGVIWFIFYLLNHYGVIGG